MSAYALEIREEIAIELGDIALFREYDWDDCYEYIFWQRMDLNLARVSLHEGQKLAYFTKAEIDRMVLAFECNQIIDDFWRAVLQKGYSYVDRPYVPSADR